MDGNIFQSVHIEDCTYKVDVGGEILVENAKNYGDDVDDCYSENEYYSAHSSEDYSSEKVHEVECLEGVVYSTNFDDPDLHSG